MSSNAFVSGARISGVCDFIAGYFEYKHKTLLIPRPATLIFRTYLMRYRVHNNSTVHIMTTCYANTIPDITIMIYACVHD